MKKFLPFLLVSVFPFTALADDQTRRVQSALSEAGFYFGLADGKMGEETRAALRRYQIRNGLDVSGEVSPETLAALKIEKSEENSAPTSATEDERQIAATTAAAKSPDAYLSPKNRESSDQVATVPEIPARSPVRDFFAETDLADASADEQSEALDMAQKRLVALNYYRSTPNGLPDAELETALLRFQHSLHLRLTGRLDADTRRALHDAPSAVASKSFRASQNRPPGPVLRGIWVH